jgi:hypothetical protein
MTNDKRKLFLVKSEQIDRFDVANGWTKVPSPLAGGPNDLDQAIDHAGFKMFAKLGSDEELSVQIYNHSDDDRFLVSIWGLFTGQEVLVHGLPSLVELLSKLGGIASAGALQAISERLAELETLMTGEDGPLEPAVLARNRQRRRDMERRKAEREKELQSGHVS